MLESLYFSLALSAHIGVNDNLNYIHPNVGFEYKNIYIGAYYNSERKTSAYAVKKFDFEHIDLNVGIVSGYNSLNVAPYISITKSLTEKTTLFLLPTIDNKTKKPALVLGIEFLIK